MDPQLAGRLGSLEEAHVGAIVAAETNKGDAEWEHFVDHGCRPWWWREMDPTTGRDECFFEGDPEWEKFVDHGGRPWWWRERDGLCFYEPARGAACTPARSGALGASILKGCCVPAAAASLGAPEGWGQPGGPSEPNAPALTGGVCARPGCRYHHKQSPRRHGFWCGACPRGEPYHTVNC
jgi:hypothetical protein